MTRQVFDTILQESQASEEAKVLERASVLFNVIQNSKKYFEEAPLVSGEIKTTLIANKF